MSDAWTAFRAGMQRVNRAPAIVFGVWCAIVASAVQIALTKNPADPRTALQWTLWPTANWIADVLLQPTDAFLGIRLHAGWTVGGLLAGGWIAWLSWTFVTGGVIDRYARDRATRADGFFAASGVFFFRFVRLAVVQVIVDAALFVAIPQAALAAAALGAWGIVVEYAKVRAVVEDRRSAVGAIAAALAFIRRHLVAVVALFACDYAALVAVESALTATADAANSNGVHVPLWATATWTAFEIGLLVWVRLVFWASETALFQMKLAHAGYVARPEPVWPDSPAAEALL